jgi:glycosyltransferase involved in cell wall biosynthesis
MDQRLDISSDLLEWGISDEFVLFCISRLEALKMVDHAIRACKLLDESNIQFKLILIGDGRERSALEALSKELDLEDKVIFAGNRSQEWISGLMRRADLNVAPLCGRALLEASLSGCPAVSYDVDWHSEIVISGQTGELVEDLDFIALGNAAKKVLLDDRLRGEMSSRMFDLAHKLASPERIAMEQVKIYEGLMSRKGKR